MTGSRPTTAPLTTAYPAGEGPATVTTPPDGRPPATPALYVADVGHRRRSPREHTFRHRTVLWLVDADRPPTLPRPLRFLARFDRTDHVDVHALLRTHGKAATRVVMLAHPRTLGYAFNPATFFWCYSGERLVARVVEVHNTYGQRHAYLLPDEAANPGHAAVVDKELYVSPFHPHHGRYEMTVSAPHQVIRASVAYRHDDADPFVATLVARRRPASLAMVAWLSVRYPWASLRTAALIRWEALRLWSKRVPVYPR